jgi:hypothetical protein
MRLELRAKKLLGGGDDDPLAGTAEAESHGRGPRLTRWHPDRPAFFARRRLRKTIPSAWRT